MRIGILSRQASLYSTSRLREAAEARGHEVAIIDYLRCYMNITSHRPHVVYHGRELNDFDAVIPRIGASNTFYGTAVVRRRELRGGALEVQLATSPVGVTGHLTLLRRTGCVNDLG